MEEGKAFNKSRKKRPWSRTENELINSAHTWRLGIEPQTSEVGLAFYHHAMLALLPSYPSLLA